ncbi:MULTISPECIES: TMEM175 family protein [Myxococcus]|uniref:TMEM175 family protein n=1 Tax=Myxococcus TaxID=32 RepID=UPI001E41F1E3|nr:MULTISPECIES: TMEM175 family protein [Myxococcus]
MDKNRLEAFSDGVIAIIITIMVLELKVPHGSELADLQPLLPVFLSYVLSFIYIGTYWNNHHHLLHTISHVTGGLLWANLHLLFWLSLIPFTTGWMGENHFAPLALALYGFVLLMCAFAWWLLQACMVAMQAGSRRWRWPSDATSRARFHPFSTCPASSPPSSMDIFPMRPMYWVR